MVKSQAVGTAIGAAIGAVVVAIVTAAIVTAAVVTVVAVTGAAAAAPSEAPPRGARASAGRGVVLGPGPVTVELDVHHSRFSPRVVRVRPHTDVRFVVVNRDPIGHELIVGDEEVHDRHEQGTEPAHVPRPGEVSAAPRGRASTTFVFHEPGTARFACHLPGHFAYGMRGRVIVVAE